MVITIIILMILVCIKVRVEDWHCLSEDNQLFIFAVVLFALVYHDLNYV